MSSQKKFHGTTITDLEDMVDNFVSRNTNPDELTKYERPSDWDDDETKRWSPICSKHGVFNIRLRHCPACERMKDVGSNKA